MQHSIKRKIQNNSMTSTDHAFYALPTFREQSEDWDHDILKTIEQFVHRQLNLSPDQFAELIAFYIHALFDSEIWDIADITAWCNIVLVNSKMSIMDMIYVCCIIDRLNERFPLRSVISVNTLQIYLFTAIITSHEMLHDISYTANAWHKIILAYTRQEIIEAQRLILSMMNWEVFVTRGDFLRIIKIIADLYQSLSNTPHSRFFIENDIEDVPLSRSPVGSVSRPDHTPSMALATIPEQDDVQSVTPGSPDLDKMLSEFTVKTPSNRSSRISVSIRRSVAATRTREISLDKSEEAMDALATMKANLRASIHIERPEGSTSMSKDERTKYRGLDRKTALRLVSRQKHSSSHH